MDLSPLQLFPGSGFETSIMTIVLLGVLIRWLYTETMGYTFAGLVVPGYLASVLIIAPVSGVVICIESVLTYLFVWLIVEYFGKKTLWSPGFGRDRFFVFALVSLFIRLFGELAVWPYLWDLASQVGPLPSQPPMGLNSLGLVLVPLAANMFWKIGVKRGALQIGVPTLLVWAIASLLLLPWTNLRFAEFQIHYEAAAIDILVSPKTYIIMLISASFAARANIKFGWDFGGILIPALIAISFFDPAKVVLSLLEALVLAGTAWLLMHKSPLQRYNLEGPRKLVLVFTTAYILKYIIAWVFTIYAPYIKVTDFFSFGYLLSSLLAIKILQRGASQVLMPIAAVSVAGFLAGGLGAEALSEYVIESPESGQEQRTTSPRTEQMLPGVLSRVALLDQRAAADAPPLTPHQLTRFVDFTDALMRQLGAARSELNEAALPTALSGLEYTKLVEPSGRIAHMFAEPRERYPRSRGLGVYILRPGSNGPFLEVPNDGADPTFALAVLEIAHATDARGIAFGAVSSTPYGGVLTPEGDLTSPYDAFCDAISASSDTLRLSKARDRSTLWLGKQMRAGNFLAGIAPLITTAVTRWEAYPSSRARAHRRDHVALELSSAATLGAANMSGEHLPPRRVMAPGKLDLLLEELLGEGAIPADVLGMGEAPSPAELHALEHGVLMTLLDSNSANTPERIELTNTVADALGLELIKYTPSPERCYWVLYEATEIKRGWGVNVINCERGEPYILQVPKPRREQGTWRLGAFFAEDFDATALTLGAPFRATTGALRREPMTSPSMLQATQRAALALRPRAWTLQLRGHAATRNVGTELLVTHERTFRVEGVTPELEAFLQRSSELGITFDYDRAEFDYAQLHGLPDLSSRYASTVASGRFARLWFGAPLRRGLTRSPSPATWLRPNAITAALFDEVELMTWAREPLDVIAVPLTDARAGELIEAAQLAAASRNPLELFRLETLLEEEGYQTRFLIDAMNQTGWLVTRVSYKGAEHRFAIRLQTTPTRQVAVIEDPSAAPTQLELNTSAALLIKEDTDGTR